MYRVTYCERSVTMKVIKISGEIGWEVIPKDIQAELDAANGDDLEVHIASPGGSVMHGIEIFNMFRDYKRHNPDSQNMAIIKGRAVSMASYLAVNPAFDLVAAEDNAVFMIHNTYGAVAGDYRDMMKMAEILDGLNDLLGSAYSRKNGKKLSDMRKLMDEESWYFGDDILKAGYVDEIIKTENQESQPEVALAEAKLQFMPVSEKIAAQKIDMNKIAAMLKPKEAQTPAQDTRENNKTEESSMTLKELLEQNPAAKIEYDNELKMKYEAGVTEGQNAMKVTIEKASKFIDSADYPVQIKNAAIDVVLGKKSIDALDSMVATADMIKEMQKSNDAKNDTDNLGETTAQNTPQPSNDGVIRNDVDFMAEVERSKKIIGVEVK